MPITFVGVMADIIAMD